MCELVENGLLIVRDKVYLRLENYTISEDIKKKHFRNWRQMLITCTVPIINFEAKFSGEELFNMEHGENKGQGLEQPYIILDDLNPEDYKKMDIKKVKVNFIIKVPYQS